LSEAYVPWLRERYPSGRLTTGMDEWRTLVAADHRVFLVILVGIFKKEFLTKILKHNGVMFVNVDV
jgi:hypothetical protein